MKLLSMNIATTVAGVILHDSIPIILGTTGVLLLVSLSFPKLNKKRMRVVTT